MFSFRVDNTGEVLQEYEQEVNFPLNRCPTWAAQE